MYLCSAIRFSTLKKRSALPWCGSALRVCMLLWHFTDKKRDSTVISRVMCRPAQCRPPLVIYLSATLPLQYSSLPLDNGRAALKCRYTWPCNSQVVRPGMSPHRPVSSYPTFSPSPQAHKRLMAVILCYLNPAVTHSFPLRNVMLFVARTFLSLP